MNKETQPKKVEAIARSQHEEFRKNNPYVALWEGQSVLMSNMARFCPKYLLGVVDFLLKEGRIVEQKMLFPERDGDSMLLKV